MELLRLLLEVVSVPVGQTAASESSSESTGKMQDLLSFFFDLFLVLFLPDTFRPFGFFLLESAGLLFLVLVLDVSGIGVWRKLLTGDEKMDLSAI